MRTRTTPCASPTTPSTGCRGACSRPRSSGRSRWRGASARAASASTAARPTGRTFPSAASSTAASAARTASPASPSTSRPSRWPGRRPRAGGRDVTVTSEPDVYYDPYDFEIDADPYPVWRRLRDEAPLYYNEKYDFHALSRFEDVEPCLADWDTYRSGQGTVLEMIRANIEIPSGAILFEDPPLHDVHRGVMRRVFTPRKMDAIEPKVREFCRRSLDPLVGTG